MKNKPIFTIHDENPQLTAMMFKNKLSLALSAQVKEVKDNRSDSKKKYTPSDCNSTRNAV
jgi:hypothetical protein